MTHQKNPASAIVDRIVEANNALWILLKAQNLPLEERVQLLERAFGARPYKCAYCREDFTTLDAKKLHEETHGGRAA